MGRYPCIEVNMAVLRHNATQVIDRCQERGIGVCGVIKGCNGLPAVAELLVSCGAAELGTSRLDQVERCRRAGIDAPFLLLRIPGLSEVEATVRLCETSLQSDVAVLRAVEAACARQNSTHRVILMADLGDLREGFWDKDEFLAACLLVERELPHVELRGIGVNLGCYGAVKATVAKMNELIALADAVEAAIGRPLETISGGASGTFPLVDRGTIPARNNHLRIGEAILNGKGFVEAIPYLRTDAFTLRGEVLEVRLKPTLPQGEQAIDAFGGHPTFQDRGIRRRALLNFGRADVGDIESLRPVEQGVFVYGGSSDHCIVDATDLPHLRSGDALGFHCDYSHTLYTTGRDDVSVAFIET